MAFREIIDGLCSPFRKNQQDRELDVEVREFVEEVAREKTKRGMTREDALRDARMEFGGVEQVKEEVRAFGWESVVWDFWQDLRFGLRMMRKSPGFTAVAVLTLGLGIGANTAVFSLADAVLFRSLPVNDPNRLVVFQWAAQKQPEVDYTDFYSRSCASEDSHEHGCSVSAPMFQRFTSLTAEFSDIAAMAGREQLLLSIYGPERAVSAEFVSGNYFRTLGVTAAFGRTLNPADDAPGAAPVAVLSFAYWHEALGGDPAVIGSPIRISNPQAAMVVTVVGVIESQFPDLEPGDTRDVWVPKKLQLEFARGRLRNRAESDDEWWIYTIARLRDGVSLSSAQGVADGVFQAAMNGRAERFFGPRDAPHLRLQPAQFAVAGLRAQFAKPLTILLLSAGLILVIACANLAGLMLVRVAARRKEMALRLALGASRMRIVRQLLTESLLLACSGCALAYLLARWSANALSTLVTRGVFHAELNARALVYSALLTIIAATALWLGAALRSARSGVSEAIAGTPTGIGASGLVVRRGLSTGDALVVAQVALSFIILAGAALLVRTLRDLRSADPGFDTSHLLLVTVDPGLMTPPDDQLRRTYLDLYERFRALPGVTSVSYSGSALLSGGSWVSSFYVRDPTGDRRGISEMLDVGPSFFETMRIPLVAGRSFSTADYRTRQSLQSAVVNEAFAREFIPTQNPIGTRLSGIKVGIAYEIVGVAADAKYTALRAPARSAVYIPQMTGRTHFEIRTSRNPESLVGSVRDATGSASGVASIRDIITQDEQIDRAITQERILARLSSLFGSLALLLACIGLYGLLSYDVTRRTREIGIRKALGAQASDVTRLVIGRGIALAGVGALIGMAISFGIMPLLKSLLYGVRPTDPGTLVFSLAIIFGVAIASSYLPARRALRVDPTVALRQD